MRRVARHSRSANGTKAKCRNVRSRAAPEGGADLGRTAVNKPDFVGTRSQLPRVTIVSNMAKIHAATHTKNVGDLGPASMSFSTGRLRSGAMPALIEMVIGARLLPRARALAKLFFGFLVATALLNLAARAEDGVQPAMRSAQVQGSSPVAEEEAAKRRAAETEREQRARAAAAAPRARGAADRAAAAAEARRRAAGAKAKPRTGDFWRPGEFERMRGGLPPAQPRPR